MFETERLILQEINLRRRLRRGFGKGFSLRAFANNGFWTTLFYRCIITVTFVASVAEQPENPNEVVSLFALVAFLCFLWQGVRLHTLCTDNAEHLRNVFYVQEDRYAVARTIKTFIEFSLVASVDVVLLAAALAIQGNVGVNTSWVSVFLWIIIAMGSAAALLIMGTVAIWIIGKAAFLAVGYIGIAWLGTALDWITVDVFVVPGRMILDWTPHGWAFQAMLHGNENLGTNVLLLAPMALLAVSLPVAVDRFRAKFRLAEVLPVLEVSGAQSPEDGWESVETAETEADGSVGFEGILGDWREGKPERTGKIAERLRGFLRGNFTVRERVIAELLVGLPACFGRLPYLWEIALLVAAGIARLLSQTGIFYPYPLIPVVLIVLIALPFMSVARRIMPAVESEMPAYHEDGFAVNHAEISKLGLKIAYVKMLCGFPWFVLGLVVVPLEWISIPGFAVKLGVMWAIWFLMLPVFASLWYGVGLLRSGRRGSTFFSVGINVLFCVTALGVFVALLAPWVRDPLVFFGFLVAGVGGFLLWRLVRFGLENGFLEIRVKRDRAGSASWF